MRLTLSRHAKKETYTIGRLFVDGVYFCDTCEDKDRGLNATMPLSTIKAVKVPGETAIPYGTYNVTLEVVSPRFAKKKAYEKIGGRLPRLLEVPGYEGVLMHIGNTAKDTEGCILVGYNEAKGKVLRSTDTFNKLYERMKKASKGGEPITITIK